ncbi:DNA damage-inducible transcript 4-like protein [Mizuhopecten yessoensis]|uniref:DNA damage-inducible transcript 4-like protein n=1 Tax=Mizuhopecten yessoensis TaxID=6573 RepID=A0A210QV83_MIZYE|nr:DNA damage-inducible transcript 4-like protein [Mizuhopecten yessoensis]OWF52635.1 DNA damage-inducible transcript 4-like protein [Mizuhopecten yessoensis]
MVETERNSNNLCAVTTKSDAVFEAVDSSRQTKVQRMLHKLKSTTVKGMTIIKGQRNLSAAEPTPVKPAQEQHDDMMDEADLSHCPLQSNFENMMEKNQWKDLVILIKQALSSVGDDKFGCELLIPCGLVMCIARDIMASARKEPCGLRGCVLFINLEDKNKCQNLVKLYCDPTTVSTFELYLTLKEDTRGWCKLKKFFIAISGYLDKKKNLDLKFLCSGYGLDKKKLYRLNN